MIISQTPFRVSFLGGGTDLEAYYRSGYGAVLSTAIDYYVYITVSKRFDDTIRVSYSRTEIVDQVDEIEHPIVREAMKMTGVTKAVEISSVADIPAGTGLGSSSSFTVGLLNALYAYQGRHVSADELAARACEIEIEILGEPIGKQDQYIAAYGGINYIRFNQDESVFVDPLVAERPLRDSLSDSLLMFYTGSTRKAGAILEDQSKRSPDLTKELDVLRDMALTGFEVLADGREMTRFGTMLDNGWQIKRELSAKISGSQIDDWYAKAMEAGALGGKLLGAGGGGFLLFYCEQHNQDRLREALADMRELPFGFDGRGSRIIFVSR